MSATSSASTTKSSASLSLKTLNLDQHLTISALNDTTKGQKMGVSLGFLYAHMRTRTLTDPRISHIVPSFKKEGELKLVLDKFVAGKWAKFDRVKSLYLIDSDGWDRAVGEAMDADAVIERAETDEEAKESVFGVPMVAYNRNKKRRNMVMQGLIQLHDLVGDKGAFQKCHAFHHICNVVSLSARVIAGILHSMEGCRVECEVVDGAVEYTLRLRKIQPTSTSKSIIATKKWFWGLEKIPEGGKIKSLKYSFLEQVELYVSAEHSFRQQFRQFLDAEGTVAADEAKLGGWYFPKDVDTAEKQRICSLSECPKYHKVPFPKKEYVGIYDDLVCPHDYWDYETDEQRVVRQRLEDLGYESMDVRVDLEMVTLLRQPMNTFMKRVSACDAKYTLSGIQS